MLTELVLVAVEAAGVVEHLQKRAMQLVLVA
jgi:hypothetical protein